VTKRFVFIGSHTLIFAFNNLSLKRRGCKVSIWPFFLILMNTAFHAKWNLGLSNQSNWKDTKLFNSQSIICSITSKNKNMHAQILKTWTEYKNIIHTITLSSQKWYYLVMVKQSKYRCVVYEHPKELHLSFWIR